MNFVERAVHEGLEVEGGLNLLFSFEFCFSTSDLGGRFVGAVKPCYFLLNFVERAVHEGLEVEGGLNLLFSFEFCFSTSDLGGRFVGAVKPCYFLLNFVDKEVLEDSVNHNRRTALAIFF